MSKKYLNIVKHYENCLEKFGDTSKGVDWPKEEDVPVRYKIMLDIVKSNTSVSLLDFGCGASHLYEHILKSEFNNIHYSGLDISEKFVALSKKKYPDNNYYNLDILENSKILPNFDYIIMNGVFTEKTTLSFDEMWQYFTKMLSIIYTKVNIGIAFNVMTKHVDWERKDLFHVPFDSLATFLTKELTRNYIIRNDYGLYEYTTYIYK